eukprot:1331089-Rhodomonas_salina.1
MPVPGTCCCCTAKSHALGVPGCLAMSSLCNAVRGEGSRAGAEESAECEAAPRSGGIDTRRGESRKGACAEHSLLRSDLKIESDPDPGHVS